MAETLISPGVLARENDQSQITSQPIQAGAALIGPTVKGRVNIPKLITSYSEYQANFGTTFESGSTNQKEEYTFLTSISAYNYFQNGGTSLIVTRVASGSFTAATSSTIFNDQESGDIPDTTNLFGSYNAGTGIGGALGATAGQFDDVATSGGSSTGLKVNVTISSGSGQFSQSADLTVSTPPAGLVADTYTVALTSGSGAGTGATATVVVAGATSITSVTVVATGSGYNAGDTLIIASGSLGASGAGGTDPIITIANADLTAVPTAIVASGSASGYAVGDVITVAKANIGNADTDLTFTLVDADITDANAFTLETIGQGEIMNNAGTLNSQGAISTGTNDNLRWEISSPNTSSGTFSVIIRRGNDTTRAKSVLESFNNVSLDPKASNYISRIIGDQTETLLGSGTAEPYLQTTGSYPNASRYVRVKSVNFKTPDYLDNSGTAKSQFTASIPVAGSGSFGDAQGSILTGTGKYYQEISGTDTQGLVGGNYTDAINLLANKDDYQYNIISVPGIISIRL